jgi:uncharacterized protein
MISEDLLVEIRRTFALRLDGIHGESHWERVRENGLRLAATTGADVQTVELFAYLHDSQRQNDGWDKEHGRRAAAYVQDLPQRRLGLSSGQFADLVYACAHHSDGLLEANVTVQTCWDADRLDLGRVAIVPDPGYLCTPAAKDPAVIEWALRRSQGLG